MPKLDCIVMQDRIGNKESMFVYPDSLTIVEHPDTLMADLTQMSTVRLCQSHITEDENDILVTIYAGGEHEDHCRDELTATSIVNAKALRFALTTADVIDWPMAKALVAEIDAYEEEDADE